MSSHPTDFQGSVIDALREAIEQQILCIANSQFRQRLEFGKIRCSVTSTNTDRVEHVDARHHLWQKPVTVHLALDELGVGCSAGEGLQFPFNNGLTVRIDKTQSALASIEARLLALTAQHTAGQREWEAHQSMMTVRLADKDAWIAILQRQITELPNDSEAPVENDAGGVWSVGLMTSLSVVEKLPGTTTRIIHRFSG